MSSRVLSAGPFVGVEFVKQPFDLEFSILLEASLVITLGYMELHSEDWTMGKRKLPGDVLYNLLHCQKACFLLVSLDDRPLLSTKRSLPLLYRISLSL